MKKILSILIIFLAVLSSYAQTEAGFLKDAKNNFVKVSTSSTKLKWSAFPPDTIIDFSVNVGGTDEPFTSLLTEIKSYWTLEEAAGNAIDSVETSDLPVYGTVARQQAGILDDCYSLTTDGYLGNIDTYYEFTGSFTLSCWIKTSSSGAYACMISDFGTLNYGYDLVMHNGGPSAAVATFAIRGAWGTVTSWGTTVINDNAWHNIIGQYNADDDSLKLWVDGNLEDKDYSTNGPVYVTDCRFRIGSRYTGMFWNGLIDEPALWNIELTQEEVVALYNAGVGYQYPFLGEGSGGDSLQLITSGYDPRGDSVRIIANPLGEGRSTSRTDGILLFAFNMADSAAYKDTTFFWPYLKDTTYIIEAYTGLWPEDIWTEDPNYDTVLVDSSDISPPPQDYPALWDTISYQDFEHRSAPTYYTESEFESDWGENDMWRDSDHRWPGWWAGKLKDSIVVDDLTSSKVLKLSFDDAYEDGYYGDLVRGGDAVGHIYLDDEYSEVYFSYNVQFRAGWIWPAGGGKIHGLYGGTYFEGVDPPDANEGFRIGINWGWQPLQSVVWYLYYQGYNNRYGQTILWDEFQPSGLDYDPATGAFLFDTDDARWYNITIRVVCNTFTGGVPNYDGIIEGYINGKLIDRQSGLYLLAAADEGKGLNEIKFAHFFGGGPHPLADEWTYFDDFIVFTYGESVDVPRGNEVSPPGRVLNLPNWPKPVQ